MRPVRGRSEVPASITAQQLAAVVLVLSKAVEGIIDALALGLRPAVSTSSSSSWRGQRLVDVDWDEDGHDAR
jgi:hypothetical protein